MQHKATIGIRGLATALGLMILGGTQVQAQCMQGGGGTGGAGAFSGPGSGGGDRIGGGGAGGRVPVVLVPAAWEVSNRPCKWCRWSKWPSECSRCNASE